FQNSVRKIVRHCQLGLNPSTARQASITRICQCTIHKARSPSFPAAGGSQRFLNPSAYPHSIHDTSPFWQCLPSPTTIHRVTRGTPTMSIAQPPLSGPNGGANVKTVAYGLAPGAVDEDI